MKAYILVLASLLAVSSCGTRTADRSSDQTSNSNNTATQSGSHDSAHDHGSMVSSPGAAQAPYDLQFIDTMIAHHQGAVDMARLADGRADDHDLKELAKDIVEDQEAEIAKMNEWRRAWFPENPKPAINMELPGMLKGMGGMDIGKLTKLNGPDFDKEFVNQMIPHHEGALEMARDLQTRTQRPELKELAATIITDQQAEIEDMKEWSDEWKNE